MGDSVEEFILYTRKIRDISRFIILLGWTVEYPVFPRGDANSKDWGCLRIIWPIIFQNCMKMKEIGLRGGTLEWQIQNFPERGRQPRVLGKNLSFGKIFAENCMKMKAIEPRRACVPSAALGPGNGGVVPTLLVGKKTEFRK